jgi:hypothetical protein
MVRWEAFAPQFLIMNGFSWFVPYHIGEGNSNSDGADTLVDMYESTEYDNNK